MSEFDINLDPLTGEPFCCATCDEGRRAKRYAEGGSFAEYVSRFMIVCPDCGNKRCPRATHHDNPCTRSNEPGQTGSAYGAAS